MPTFKRSDFITSEDGIKATEILNQMFLDDAYITQPSFSANSEKYTDNLIPFIDKHLNYIQSHPSTNYEHYLSNLKLMTRIRP